ncbi:hypothetical protein Tco_0340899 [Tanacetum coccineum]
MWPLISTPSNNTAKLSDATIYAFLANQPNGSQVVHEDLEQIHEDDLEEIDLKWQLALLSMKSKKVLSENCKEILSTMEVILLESSSKAMLAIDGAGFYWIFMGEEDVPANFALMAFSDSEVFDCDEDETLEKVSESANVQKPKQADQPRKTRLIIKNYSNSRSKYSSNSITPPSLGLVSISTARQSSSRAAAPVSSVRPIKTAAPKPFVNVVKSRPNALHKSHSPSRRSFYQHTTLKNRNLNNRVNIVKVNSVNTAKGKSVISAIGEQEINAVKSKECWVWRPKIKVLDHVSKKYGSYIYKQFDYVDPTVESVSNACVPREINSLMSINAKMFWIVISLVFELPIMQCWLYTTQQMVINLPCLTDKKELTIPGQTTTDAQTRFEAASKSLMIHLSQEVTHLEVGRTSKIVEQAQERQLGSMIRYQALKKKPVPIAKALGSEPSQEQSTEEPTELSEEDLKEMLEIVPVEETKAEALQVKYPIVDWEVHTEGSRRY